MLSATSKDNHMYTKITLQKTGEDKTNKSGVCNKQYSITLVSATHTIFSFGKIDGCKNEKHVVKSAEEMKKLVRDTLNEKLKKGYKVTGNEITADLILSNSFRLAA